MPPPALPSAEKRPSGHLPHSPAGRSWRHPPSDPQRSAPARLPAQRRSPDWPCCYPSASARQLPEKRPARKRPSVRPPPSGCRQIPRLQSSPQNCQCDCCQRHPSESEMPPPVLPSAVKQPSGHLPHSPAAHSMLHLRSIPLLSAFPPPSGCRQIPRLQSSPQNCQCDCWLRHPSDSVRRSPVLPSAVKLPSGHLPHSPAGRSWRHPR